MGWTWPTVWLGERGGWWRFLATLALFEGGCVLGLALFGVLNGGLRESLGNEPAQVKEAVRVVLVMLPSGLGLAGCLAGVRLLHHKSVACVFTDGRPFRLGLAVQSLAVWTVLWLAGTVSLPRGWQCLARRAGEIPPAWWAVLGVLTLCAAVVQCTTEEVVFRGYLLTRVAAWVKRPSLAVGITALIFAAVHLRWNPPSFAAVTLFGIALGVACIRAGTVAPLAGMHAANNALMILWFPQESSMKAHDTATTWAEVVVALFQLTIWLIWLLWVTRRRPIENLAQGGAANGSQPFRP